MSISPPPLWEPLKPPVPRASMPRHVAIIMDGNGRWAVRRKSFRIRGHEAGAEAVRSVVRYSGQIHLEALTLYAFSSENWQRPRTEVQFLMRLLKKYLINELDELHANGVRLRSIGRVEELPEDVLRELRRCQEVTANNSGLNLCLALNYGARAEMVDVARSLAQRVASGDLSEDQIDLETVTAGLHTGDLPTVDVLIRTAAEQRVSNFLLWQSVDAEFICTDICWPDFRAEQLKQSIVDYTSRRLIP